LKSRLTGLLFSFACYGGASAIAEKWQQKSPAKPGFF
jgi:hypothetical protein